jgi:integrase
MPRYKLTKRPDSPCWYVAWFDGGRPRRCSTGETVYERAEAFLDAFKLRILDPSVQVGVMAVLNDYKENILDHLPSKKNAQLWVDNLEKHFGNLTVAEIDDDAIEGFVKNRGASVETIRRELSVLNSALRRAERRKVIVKAPFIQLPPKPAPRERYLTRTEAARLLWASRRTEHLKTFLRLALYTGARPGAIFDLTWDRVDLENGFVDYGQGVGNKRRGIKPIDGALRAALGRVKVKKGYVVQWNGKKVQRVNNAFRKAVKRAGLKDTGVIRYTLRHTMATWAAMAGADLHGIGGMLDHSDPKMTARYSKYHPEYLRQTARAALRGKR